MAALSRKEEENARRIAEAEAAKKERKAVRLISHRPDGGARGVAELRDMCEELGISNGGFRDDLIKRIRTHQREKEAAEEKARIKGLKKARKKAEKGVARGVAQMEAEDYIGAAKNFAKSEKVLADYPDSQEFKTTTRCLKALRTKLVALEAEAEFSLKNFLIEQESLIGRSGRTEEQDRDTQRLLRTVRQDFGPEEPSTIGTAGRCRVCTLANPCELHTPLEQRAHKLLAMQTLVAPESEQAETRQKLVPVITEELERSTKFSDRIAAEAAAARAAEADEALRQFQLLREREKMRKTKAEMDWKKQMEEKRSRENHEIWRQEAIAAERRADELQRTHDARAVRVKHLKKMKQSRDDLKREEMVLGGMTDAVLGSRERKKILMRRYDIMLRKHQRKKEEEERQRRQRLEAEVLFGKAQEAEAFAASDALSPSKRGAGQGGALMLTDAKTAARREADAAIWGLVGDALDPSTMAVGVSFSLPNIPAARPISAGKPGSTFGVGKRGKMKAEKAKVVQHLADLEQKAIDAAQAAEDKRWAVMEEEGTVVVEVVRAKGLKGMDVSGHADPFVVLSCDRSFEWDSPHDTSTDVHRLHSVRTNTKKRTKNPRWDQQFELHGVHNRATFTATVYDWDRTGDDDPMGQVQMTVRTMRGNMWQKSAVGGVSAEEEGALMIEDEMAKKEKLIKARQMLQHTHTAAADAQMRRSATPDTRPESQGTDMTEERARDEVWYKLEPMEGCERPRGEISIQFIATFKPRGPGYRPLIDRGDERAAEEAAFQAAKFQAEEAERLLREAERARRSGDEARGRALLEKHKDSADTVWSKGKLALEGIDASSLMATARVRLPSDKEKHHLGSDAVAAAVVASDAVDAAERFMQELESQHKQEALDERKRQAVENQPGGSHGLELALVGPPEAGVEPEPEGDAGPLSPAHATFVKGVLSVATDGDAVSPKFDDAVFAEAAESLPRKSVTREAATAGVLTREVAASR